MIRKANGQNLRLSATGAAGSNFSCVTETVLGSLTLPADFLSTGSIINLTAASDANPTTDSFRIRLYFNTTATTSGALLLADPSASNSWGVLYRRYFFDSATTAKGLPASIPTAAGTPIDDIGGWSLTGVGSFTFSNWLVGGGVFFITAQRYSGNGTANLKYIVLET